MGDVQVEPRRSGFAEWPYDLVCEHWLTLPLLPVVLLGNLLTHLLVFRRGWTLHIRAGDHYFAKVRYRSKADALADLERQKALAAEMPPPEPVKPVRLPTRGGSLRRPW
ncbi:MAG TPA: hypothetical protein VG497_05280 [Kribbella sp.]|nr:hypothetical protein [Kribbella sp.]